MILVVCEFYMNGNPYQLQDVIDIAMSDALGMKISQ